MTISYSIAEARDQFAALVHQVEKNNEPIQVTRRGESVAVILSQNVYQQLLTQNSKLDTWQAYLAYMEQWQAEEIDIEGDIWAEIRDKSPGKEVNPWL